MQGALVAPNATGCRDRLRRTANRMVRELWATMALGKEQREDSQNVRKIKLVVETLFQDSGLPNVKLDSAGLQAHQEDDKEEDMDILYKSKI